MSAFLKSAVRSPWAAAALLLFAAVLWLFADVLQGKVFFFGDLSLYFLPQLAFEKRELLMGRIPLWNPYLFFGQPFVGNPQSWPLYPSALLLWWGDVERANAISTIVQVLWLAVGCLLFLRHRGLGPGAATLGALVFSCGGAVVSKAQFPNMLQAESWLPWQLLAADCLIMRVSAGRVAALALVAGLGLLAAHAQISMMQFYLVLAWCVFRLWKQPAWRRSAVALLLAGLLGAGLAMGQLLPVVQHARDSVRPELTLPRANRFYLPFDELRLFLLPNSLGNPATARVWRGHGNFWEPCCYLGIVPIVLILLGATRFKRLPREARFWLGVGVLGFWLALGRAGGLYSVVFTVVPGVKQFHDPARFLYLGTFGIAVLAAIVFHERLGKRPRWQVVVLILAAVDLISFSRTLNPTTFPDRLAEGRARLTARLAGQSRVFHTGPYQPWGRWISYRDSRIVLGPGEVEEFIGSATPNLPLWVGVRQAGGYEPVVRKDVNAVLGTLGELPLPIEELTPSQKTLLASWAVDQIYGYNRETREVTKAALPKPQSLASLGSWSERSPQELVVTDPTGMVGPLIVRETHAPGWAARADGVPLTLEVEEGIFRRVTPPSGTRRVEFHYDPTPWRVGMFISLGTACILVALTTTMVRSRAWQT